MGLTKNLIHHDNVALFLAFFENGMNCAAKYTINKTRNLSYICTLKKCLPIK